MRSIEEIRRLRQEVLDSEEQIKKESVALIEHIEEEIIKNGSAYLNDNFSLYNGSSGQMEHPRSEVMKYCYNVLREAGYKVTYDESIVISCCTLTVELPKE